jgi:outer membrane lipoprotein SlyB
MAIIICPKCSHNFDSNNPESIVTRGATAIAFSGAGAYFGSGIGIAGGPFGAIAGTIPGAIVGCIAGYCGADQMRRCPNCSKIFKT